MDGRNNRQTGVREAPPELFEEGARGGPLATTGSDGNAYYSPPPARGGLPTRTKLERIGFWIIVVAALALLLVLLGVILPPVMGGVITGFYTGLFAASLTLMNLPRPSGWANAMLGRRVFPVLRVTADTDLWRQAGVNGALMAVFAFFFSVVAAFLGPFFGGMIVFGGLTAAGVFYNRARRVIIKP